MAKKKEFKETTIENYYDLKVDKVEELVAALKDENHEFGSEVSMNISDCTGIDDPKNRKRNGKEKQFDPYRTDLLSKIPHWLIALLVKWWFFGAICYFVNWGLGTYVTNTLDMFVLTGLVTGIVVDVLVNPIFRFLETDRREYDNFTMFPFPLKAIWTLFANIVYYVAVTYGASLIYLAINLIIQAVDPAGFLAIEPILFGVFMLIFDMIFIGIKDAVVYLIKKNRRKGEINV